MLERLKAALAARRERLRALLDINDRDLTSDELREFDGLTGSEGDDSISALEARVAQVEEQEARAARAQAALVASGTAGPEVSEQRANAEPRVRVGAEPETYRKGGQQSYFRDLIAASINPTNARGAVERLQRNDREVQERALTTVDGAGGDFVPPLWMVSDFIELARAARVTADRVRNQKLPTGTDSINVPRLLTGTAVAEQATQNTAVQNTDATTNALTAAVTTLAGQQVVSVQLVEQSPINFDEILLADLAADYATKVDVFVINNNAANKLGLLNVSGLNAITYTDASPTVPEVYPKIADAIQQIHTGRFLPADAIVMHPRRWAWFLSGLDSSNRPLIVPSASNPFNSLAAAGEVTSQGFVGTIQGLPVFVDPSVPINLGGGTNEDRIIVGRFSDAILWEGNAHSEAFRETYANQLSVLLRFYNYVAFTGSRYPKSFSVVAGTGLVTPTF